jgi:uncharacterized protein (DUF2235 family)
MKNIVLLSDGTGNSAAKVWRTNVWRLFQSLDLKGSNQIAIYDDGVGTSSFLPLAILGGAFGWGLKRNVRELYKFLCRNYQDGDRIYGFGFSRGAFTIRVFIGMVLNQGLVKFSDEAELDKKARAAYRAYRDAKYPAWNLQYPFRVLQILRDRRFYKPCDRPIKKIDFLGLWDTVAAYGLPIDEMTRGVNNWIWPLELPNREFDQRILKARHALAIDDERETFSPVLWDEGATNTRSSGVERPTNDEQLLQVWFTGMHANVGGGYPDDALANVSLSWIMAEAQQAGLVFKEMANAEPDALLTTDSAKDKDGRLYDSRSGVGGYYRYNPRRIADFYEGMPQAVKRRQEAAEATSASAEPQKLLPKIHETVFGKIKIGAHPYAPIGLPGNYEVVTTGNVSVAYNLPPDVTAAPMTIVPNTKLVAEGDGSASRHADQEDIWDMVWRKRGIYFLTVFATVYLLAYPLFRNTYAYEEARTRLHVVSDTLRVIGSLTPAFAKRWIDAYAHEPAWFVLILLLVILLTGLGSSLSGSIKNNMRPLWVASLPGTNPTPIIPAISIGTSRGSILATIAGLLLVFHPVFADRLPWPTPLGSVRDFLAVYLGPPVNVVLGLAIIACYLPSARIRVLREHPAYKATLRFFKNNLAPFLSAAVILLLVVGLVCHFGFNLLDGFGFVCHENGRLGEGPGKSTGFEDGPVKLTFDISSPDHCTSTGVYLTRGKSYYIEVDRDPADQEWTFFGVPSYMGDAPISRLPLLKQVAMVVLLPFRRVFDRPWGSLILRTGGLGTEVDYLDRDPPPETDDIRADVTQSKIPKVGEQLSEPLKATRSGELFIYANKPVIGLLSALIGSTGKATVQIRKK